MVNSDKVRVLTHYVRLTADALQRALDAIERRRFDQPDCEYITDQLDRANEDFLMLVHEWSRVNDQAVAGKGA